jgi:hypothetical protein
MAGSITANTIQSDNSSAPTFRNDAIEIGRLCRAWVNFNGSGGSVNRSFNVSSITVNGTGNYTINMTNALADTSYGCFGFCTDASLSRGGGIGSTSAFSMQCSNGIGTALVNPTNVFAAAFS